MADEPPPHSAAGAERPPPLARAWRRVAGTDPVAEAERLCLEVLREFPRTTFFAGKVVFERERWYQRPLRNKTAFAIQKRPQWVGQTMVILPAKVRAGP
jgi:hypothetical protein